MSLDRAGEERPWCIPRCFSCWEVSWLGLRECVRVQEWKGGYSRRMVDEILMSGPVRTLNYLFRQQGQLQYHFDCSKSSRVALLKYLEVSGPEQDEAAASTSCPKIRAFVLVKNMPSAS